MVVPAALYLAVNLASADGNTRGWAVPTATDIAFAVAVLAIVGRSLPNALRAFLLTLAVVDDLLAIIVIGVFYTETVSALWLGAGALGGGRVRARHPARLDHRVAAGAARGGDVGRRARVRGARDDRRRGARPRRAGHLGVHPQALRLTDEPAESLAERWEHTWRPAVGRVRGPRVRALRGRGDALGRARCRRRSPTRSPRGSPSASCWASPSASWWPPGWSPASRAPPWRPASAGRTSRAVGLLGRHRVHRVAPRGRAGLRRRQRARRPRGRLRPRSRRSPPPCSAVARSPSATGTTHG